MADLLDRTETDEYALDSPRLRQFIEAVKTIRTSYDDPKAIIAAIRPHFEALLADQTWLPTMYQEPHPEGGMGSGIGTWLLYRTTDGSLALSSLVVPPGAQTPVHDHLAWGLVGLYRGEQDEEVFARNDDGSSEDHAKLEVIARNHLKPGDFYELLPEVDIHRVKTTSDVTSVSLHLLGIDNGCIWRHRFLPEEERIVPFKSGYVNVACEQDETAPAS
ncbi:MAG: 3-mercaptopropionate dioxygenase [Thermomicrobiales bacterium]|jgi:predicted metal-dependent enzyme (double-stranded beta helix superfamily)|nr:3-mercaptopropionate dioxygenase [Thermomicrobiales bacterium]